MRRVAFLLATLLSIGGVAEAQTSASGRAFGTTVDLLGGNLVDQSDTQEATAPSASNAPNPSAFDRTAAGATIPASPIAEVVTGPSRTRGCVDAGGCANLGGSVPQGQFVLSEAGNATASVLPGAAPGGVNLLDAVSNGSTAQVSCDPAGGVAVAGNSGIDLLVVAGNKVPLPGTVPPNTTIVVPQLPLLVVNEQACPDPDAPAGTARCTVNALHAQLASPIVAGILDLKLSGSTASLTNATCPGNGNCNPNLTNSVKTSTILRADRTAPKNPQVPAIGDPIRFTVAATNSAVLNEACGGSQTGHHLRVIDRIPRGVTVDPTSITIQTDNGTPVPTTGTIAPCAANLEFTGCNGEPASDGTRQCLTITDGDLAPAQTKRISFIATVNSSATGGSTVGCDGNGTGAGICNTALIQIDEIQNPSGTPRTSAIQCPIPNGGDQVRTTGSGGCSLGFDSRGRSEAIPMLLVGAWLLIRRWRQGSARA